MSTTATRPDYTCEIDGCEASQRNGGIMCAAHWRKVPSDLRDEIYAAARRWSKRNGAYEKYEAQPSGKIDPESITALAQKVNDAYDAWTELRDTAVGEVELQEAET